jgi:hypothetical protein
MDTGGVRPASCSRGLQSVHKAWSGQARLDYKPIDLYEACTVTDAVPGRSRLFPGTASAVASAPGDRRRFQSPVLAIASVSFGFD